jgi:photosystem II stability/assembly factor-like uncharacterized protein
MLVATRPAAPRPRAIPSRSSLVRLAAGAGCLVAGAGSLISCGETVARSYLLVTVQGVEAAAPGGEAPSYQLVIQLGTDKREVQPSEARLSEESPPRFAVRLPDDAAGQTATVRVTAYLGDCPAQTAVSAAQTVGAGVNPVSVRLPARPATACTLSVVTHGPGRVVSQPPGISCPGTCSARFSPQQRVTLTATPSGGVGGLQRWDLPSACGGAQSCELGEIPPAGVAAEVTMAAGPPAIDRCATTAFTRVVPSPVASTLHGVWVGANGEAWAVGDGGVVLRRAGSWRIEPLVGGPTALETLTAVWGTGSPATIFFTGPSSTVWVRRDTGTLASYRRTGGLAQLRAISGSSRSEVWGVGDGGEVLRIDDAGGTSSVSPLGDGVTGTRSAVWTDAPNNVWFVADSGQLTHRTSPGPSAGTVQRSVSAGVRGISGSTLGPLWVVGPSTSVWRIPASLTDADGYGAPQNLSAAPGLPGSTLALSSVWTDGGNVWIVGDSGALYCKPSGSDTWRQISGQSLNLRSIHGFIGTSASDSRLIVVGAQGAILESPL